MNNKKFGKITILLIFMPFYLLVAKQEHHYNLKNADVIEYETLADDTLTKFTGNVNLIYDDIEFFSDLAIISQYDKKVLLIGNVKAIEDTLESGAHRVTYFHNKGEMHLKKNAYFKEMDISHKLLKEVNADKIIYYKNDKKIEANNKIRAKDFLENVNLTCGKFIFDFIKNYGYAKEDPILIFARQENIKIYSKQMEFFSDKNKFTATYDVKILVNNSEARGKFLIFFQNENKAVLLGEPEFTNEMSDAFAEEFRIYFIKESIDKFYLKNNAEIFFKNKNQKEKLNYLFADLIVIKINGEKVSTIHAENVSKSFIKKDDMEDSNVHTNYLKTKQLEVYFDNEENIEEVIAEKAIIGTYKFPKKE